MSYIRVGGSTVCAIIGIILAIVSHSKTRHDSTKGSDASVSFACVLIKTSVITAMVCLLCSFVVQDETIGSNCQSRIIANDIQLISVRLCLLVLLCSVGVLVTHKTMLLWPFE